MHVERPAVLDRLPAGYQRLFDRTVEVLTGDERVRAMWLGGSLARGTADAASDLDVFVAVGDDDHEAFAAGWQALLADITPTVLAQEQPWARGCFWSITPGFERFDLVTEPVSSLESTFFRTRALVFDRDGLDERIPPPADGPGPNAGKLAQLVESWFHFSAMLEVVFVRRDWLLFAEHLHFLRNLVYELFVEANAPLPAMGLKQWSTKLTEPQCTILDRLPTAAHSPAEVLDAHLAHSRAFLGTARPLAAEIGVAWPTELEAAATAHLREVLGVDDVYPERED